MSKETKATSEQFRKIALDSIENKFKKHDKSLFV